MNSDIEFLETYAGCPTHGGQTVTGFEDSHDWRQHLAEHGRRLRALEDERGILDTLYQYCHTLDFGLEEEWMDCFTEDAVWCWSVKDTFLQGALERQGFGTIPVGVLGTPLELEGELLAKATVGHEQLRKMVAGHTNAPDRWHKHCVMNTRVAISGDDASANSYFVRVDASVKTTGAYIRAMGRYLDELVRCDDGKWRIRQRYCALEAHYDEVVFEG